ncbi:MAG: trypsin-like peptidase domain-containing protein [Defluviitaleaceae bacterium]|nr:trypsin-like peptidase domain-containing protein [Defluviitaleaceae bacterium]
MDGKKLLFIALALCIGGATLGLGIGAGYAVVRHFSPSYAEIVWEAAVPAETTITTVRVNPLVVPLEPQEPSFVDIIPEVKDSVVSINVTAPSGRGMGRGEIPGSGSGFVFAEDAEYIFIATNNHVVENTTSIVISLDDEDSVPARIVGYDRASDVAVIVASRADLREIEARYTVARPGNSDALRMGDSVIAIGNAMGEGQTVTRGIISALSLSIDIPDARNRLTLDVLQTDAAVNRGNSGGPLINQYGEVIGIVTAKLIGADIEGMGYALPINNVYHLLMDILETGSVRRSFIGVVHTEISEQFRNVWNFPSTGILVTEIMADSPAYEAGILPRDLIVQFDDRRITGTDSLRDALEATRPGTEITLGLYRDGIRMDVQLVLASRMH